MNPVHGIILISNILEDIYSTIQNEKIYELIRIIPSPETGKLKI
ncbi:MAG: hypothetical protein ACOC35_05180 [Promethearchaeia archaeon]